MATNLEAILKQRSEEEHYVLKAFEKEIESILNTFSNTNCQFDITFGDALSQIRIVNNNVLGGLGAKIHVLK